MTIVLEAKSNNCAVEISRFLLKNDTDQTGQEICPTQWCPNFDQIYGRHGVDPSFSCLVRAELIFPYRACQLDLESGQLAIWQYGFVVQCCGWMVLDMHMTIFGRDHPNSSSEGGGGNSGGGGRGNYHICGEGWGALPSKLWYRFMLLCQYSTIRMRTNVFQIGALWDLA